MCTGSFPSSGLSTPADLSPGDNWSWWRSETTQLSQKWHTLWQLPSCNKFLHSWQHSLWGRSPNLPVRSILLWEGLSISKFPSQCRVGSLMLLKPIDRLEHKINLLLFTTVTLYRTLLLFSTKMDKLPLNLSSKLLGTWKVPLEQFNTILLRFREKPPESIFLESLSWPSSTNLLRRWRLSMTQLEIGLFPIRYQIKDSQNCLQIFWPQLIQTLCLHCSLLKLWLLWPKLWLSWGLSHSFLADSQCNWFWFARWASHTSSSSTSKLKFLDTVSECCMEEEVNSLQLCSPLFQQPNL